MRKIYVYVFIFLAAFFTASQSRMSLAVIYDPALENACKASGGQCGTTVQCNQAEGWTYNGLTCTTGIGSAVIPCCVNNNNPCLSNGHTCSRQKPQEPGKDYVEVDFDCSEDEQKCWKETSMTSDCDGPCVAPTEDCPDGTHPVAKQCIVGTRCCENDDTQEICSPVSNVCGGGGCGRCSKCKLVGSEATCVYVSNECAGCGGDADNPSARSTFYDLFYKGPIVQNIESILNPLGKILFWGGLFIGMAFIVIAGYTLMTSEGNPQKTQEGQEQLTAAILGIAFILLSSAILRVIISLV